VSRYVDEHRGRFGVEPICRTLGVSASAYYERATGRRSRRAVEDERLLTRIRELHAANYHAYGYRRMWKTLRRAGEQVPRCRVQRLMKSHGIQGAKRLLRSHESVELAPASSIPGERGLDHRQGVFPRTRASERQAAGSWRSPWKTASTLFPSGSMTNAA
jgi:putative transposase